MEEKIAIVIPAYKCRFLRQTLDSIVVQTCRSFTSKRHLSADE